MVLVFPIKMRIWDEIVGYLCLGKIERGGSSMMNLMIASKKREGMLQPSQIEQVVALESD